MAEARSYAQPRAARRRAVRRRAALPVLILALAVALAPVAEAKTWPSQPYPASKRVAAAREFAAAASGTVAFAVIDSDGGLRGYDAGDAFSSASASKALLLAAELRRLLAAHEPLDAGTRSLLESMITASDNDAASAIYARVGDAGMDQVADAAGMRSFSVDPGFWGGAQLTAADLARFYFHLNHNLAGPYRRYGKRLLARVVSSQRWGIPAAAPRRWRVYLKGGWRPAGMEGTTGAVTHQGALLVDRSGRRVGLAILTDLAPGSTSYAILEGITERLLAEPPQTLRWVAP
ncbi:MAG TPA: serine hydrolase [Solirubrobacterales bacterium]|nr:serine hydrolase [Solirubrobacterales bacterium]